ncbi:CD27 antigen-like [Salarias fasciatus]|uniref:CD27 antigen-like n=1 Tax=Salarias fasciatus TaxID=181472 RepID=UPI0011768973|nr:CD27 antigen-like [Salarias fasciatus]
MLPLCFLTLACLCSLWAPALSIECDEKTQYAWPINKPQKCCNKCPPGHYMSQDPNTSCNVKCEPCIGKRYMETYNVKMHCEVCNFCSYPNMEHESNCSTTRNAVCRCKPGYVCKENDKVCEKCEQISTITATRPPPYTLRPTARPPPSLRLPPARGEKNQLHTSHQTWSFSKIIKPLHFPTGMFLSRIITDPMWFLVIIALLCAGIALLVAKKIRPLLHWIRSRHGVYFLPEKTAVQPLSPEDEVSKPVQEVSCECESTDLYVKV